MPGGPDMGVAATPGGSEASNEDGTATCNICYKVHKNYKDTGQPGTQSPDNTESQRLLSIQIDKHIQLKRKLIHKFDINGQRLEDGQ